MHFIVQKIWEILQNGQWTTSGLTWSSLGPGGFFGSTPPSREAAMLLTLPGLSVTTPPPEDEVELLSLNSPLVVLLTELSLLGGGGGGPFFLARTAKD